MPVAAPAAAKNASAPPPEGPWLEFHVVLDKSSYAPTDPILFRVALKNIGAKPIWVVSRFYVSAPQIAPQHRDVYLELLGPSGQPVTSPAKFETGFPKTDDFKELQPGADVAAQGQVNLRYLFDLKEPGTYRVTAVYENVFGPELGLDTFRGTLRSDPVTFTIQQAP